MGLVDVDTSPSASARMLFGRMVAKSDGAKLNIGQALTLSIEMVQEGRNPLASSEIAELQDTGWIRRDGGSWLLC